VKVKQVKEEDDAVKLRIAEKKQRRKSANHDKQRAIDEHELISVTGEIQKVESCSAMFEQKLRATEEFLVKTRSTLNTLQIIDPDTARQVMANSAEARNFVLEIENALGGILEAITPALKSLASLNGRKASSVISDYLKAAGATNTQGTRARVPQELSWARHQHLHESFCGPDFQLGSAAFKPPDGGFTSSKARSDFLSLLSAISNAKKSYRVTVEKAKQLGFVIAPA